MTEETSPAPDGEPQPAGESVGHELAHVAQSGEGGPVPEDETLGEEVAHVVESAAELGLGAVIAPFTGGETVNIVGSVASMLEAGVDRLTHLGEHESPSEPEADDTDDKDDADRTDEPG
jgi:hypothetical protein